MENYSTPISNLVIMWHECRARSSRMEIDHDVPYGLLVGILMHTHCLPGNSPAIRFHRGCNRRYSRPLSFKRAGKLGFYSASCSWTSYSLVEQRIRKWKTLSTLSDILSDLTVIVSLTFQVVGRGRYGVWCDWFVGFIRYFVFLWLYFLQFTSLQ